MTRIDQDPASDQLTPGKSIIVVSDLHLGLSHGDEVSKEFLLFLNFIADLRPKGDVVSPPTVEVEGKHRELFAPEKIILLGDIIDLWSPRKNNRAFVLSDSYPVIRKLLTLPCEKIYVTGNHDNEINEVAGIVPDEKCPEITIVDRHYPEGIGPAGQKKYPGFRAGKHNYYFLHGQQFDILFICATFLRDYPGWVANNHEVFKENPGLKWAFRGIFIITFLYLVANYFGVSVPEGYNTLLHILFGISLMIFFFSLNTAWFRAGWDFMAQKTKAKDQPIRSIVELGFWKIKEGEKITADVVVFGHTHLADDSFGLYSSRYGKRFINSGSWGHGKQDRYTFIYIDEDGPLLFRWVRKNNTSGYPEFFGRTSTGDPTALKTQILSIRRILIDIRTWFRQNLSKGG